MKVPVLVAVAVALTMVPALQPAVDAQLPAAPDNRFAGLQWRFVRIKYHYATEGTHIPQDFYGEPWGIVPSLAHKPLPYSWGSYRPEPVEIIIMLATFAAMVLLYMLFSKFVPIISIWEMKVGNQPHPPVVTTDEDELAGLWRARP